jgi:hypothetical protein
LNLPPNFPATLFICDIVRYQMNQLTKQDIRNRWKAGDYAGVPVEWAKWNVERA